MEKCRVSIAKQRFILKQKKKINCVYFLLSQIPLFFVLSFSLDYLTFRTQACSTRTYYLRIYIYIPVRTLQKHTRYTAVIVRRMTKCMRA